MVEALERLSSVLVEYNTAACLHRGFALPDTCPDAPQPFDCDFGTVRPHTYCMSNTDDRMCHVDGGLAPAYHLGRKNKIINNPYYSCISLKPRHPHFNPLTSPQLYCPITIPAKRLCLTPCPPLPLADWTPGSTGIHNIRRPSGSRGTRARYSPPLGSSLWRSRCNQGGLASGLGHRFREQSWG